MLKRAPVWLYFNPFQIVVSNSSFKSSYNLLEQICVF